MLLITKACQWHLKDFESDEEVSNIILIYSPAYIFLFLNMESRKNKDGYERENVGDLSNIKINNIF